MVGRSICYTGELLGCRRNPGCLNSGHAPGTKPPQALASDIAPGEPCPQWTVPVFLLSPLALKEQALLALGPVLGGSNPSPAPAPPTGPAAWAKMRGCPL